MPHVIVKLWPGKSERQKKSLAEAITKDITEILNNPFPLRWKKSNRTIGWRKSIGPKLRTAGTSSTRSPDTTRSALIVGMSIHSFQVIGANNIGSVSSQSTRRVSRPTRTTPSPAHGQERPKHASTLLHEQGTVQRVQCPTATEATCCQLLQLRILRLCLL